MKTTSLALAIAVIVVLGSVVNAGVVANCHNSKVYRSWQLMGKRY